MSNKSSVHHNTCMIIQKKILGMDKEGHNTKNKVLLTQHNPLHNSALAYKYSAVKITGL